LDASRLKKTFSAWRASGSSTSASTSLGKPENVLPHKPTAIAASFGAGDVDVEHVRSAERALRAASERYDQTARQLGLPTSAERG
jgi:hypothetical protein